MTGYFVKVLSAMVKVCRRAEDGTQLMRTAGFHPGTGEPLLVPDVRNVTLQKGEPLPDDVAQGEVDRLLGLDPPAIGRKAAVSVMAAPTSTSKKAAAGKRKSSAKKRSAAKKSTAKKSTAKRSTAKRSPAAAKPPAVDLGKLAELSDADLAAAIAGVGVKKLVEAIGSDAELAQRVLAAEKTASAGDPRKPLVDALEKVVAGKAA